MNAPKIPVSSLQGQYAGFVSRFIAWMIDILVVIAIVTLLGFTLDIILRFFRLDDLVAALTADSGIVGSVVRGLALFGSVASIATAYFVVIWTISGGQSVGKAIIGLRIVPFDGSKIGLWRSLLRYAAFILAALPLFLGLLWVLVSDRRQGWHDKIARTCVIYDWPARENDHMIGRLQSRLAYIKQTQKRLRSRPAPSSKQMTDGGSRQAADEGERMQR